MLRFCVAVWDAAPRAPNVPLRGASIVTSSRRIATSSFVSPYMVIYVTVCSALLVLTRKSVGVPSAERHSEQPVHLCNHHQHHRSIWFRDFFKKKKAIIINNNKQASKQCRNSVQIKRKRKRRLNWGIFISTGNLDTIIAYLRDCFVFWSVFCFRL